MSTTGKHMGGSTFFLPGNATYSLEFVGSIADLSDAEGVDSPQLSNKKTPTHIWELLGTSFAMLR